MDKLFPALCLLWIASEIRILWHRRSGDPARKRDAGTLRLLVIVIGASVALAAGFDGLDVARFPRQLQAPLWWLGIALMLAGMPLRWWSIRVLARHFTVDVTIHPDHRSDAHTSELQSLMRISYAVFCLTKNNKFYDTLTATN